MNTKQLKFNKEFATEVMTNIPFGYINKTVPGCGLSSVALESNTNTILAVPNITLVNNKVAQYPNERSSYKILGVQGGTTTQEITDFIQQNKQQPIKIICTYDSMFKIEFLMDLCVLVIDESQEILKSQKLKCSSKKSPFQNDVITTLLEFAYKYKDKVSFISATPIPLEYLPKWISELDQVVMEWDNTIKVKPILMERTYVNKAVRNEIITPIEENGSVTIGGLTFSKLIIFINSVGGIIDIINKSQISKEDVRVIAGESVENDIKLKGIKRLTEYNNLTKYTFITGTGFKGIDLYDNNAMSIVISNTAKDYNMVDLTTDLQQAISRNRTKSNPNYGRFIYIYNQNNFGQSKEELIALMDNNKESVLKQIRSYELNKAGENVEGFRWDELFETYSIYHSEDDCFTFNENLYNADKYFILETKENYRKGFTIKGSFNDSLEYTQEINIKEASYYDVALNYKQTDGFEGFENQLEYINIIKETIKLYNKVFLDKEYAEEMIKAYSDDFKQVAVKVRKAFKKDTYTVSEVKEILQTVYDEENILRTAKVADLQEFMTIFIGTIRIGGFSVKGIKIIDKYRTNK